jgi:tetratricopeptide (TPR) repeat protein
VIADPIADEAWHGTATGELLRAQLRVPAYVAPLDGDETAPLARELAAAKDADARRAETVRIGATTNAQILITGTLRGGELRVQLIDLASGERIEDYAEPVDGDDLAPAVARLGATLRGRLAGAEVPLDADQKAQVLPSDPAAARAYAEGLERARAHDHQHAIESLEHATSLAKDFGPAYLVLVGELRAVRQQAKAAIVAESAHALAGTLRNDQFLRAEAFYRESRKEWAKADESWSTLLAATPDDVRIAIARAQALLHAGDADRCFEVLDQMRSRPAPIGDDPRIDVQEAFCARQAGDFRRGLSAATRAEVKATVRGVREPLQAALALHGEMLADAGEYDRALVALDRAKHLANALGDPEAMIETLRQIGYVLGEQGKADEAASAFRDAIARAKQIGDRLSEGIVLNDFGQSVTNQDDALAMFKDALVIAKAEGDERLVTAVSLNLANKQDGTGHIEDALATYADVIARAKAQHDDENLATAELNRSDSLMKLDRYADALPAIDVALASYQERGDEDGVGYALSSRGDAHYGLGDLAAARTDYEASLALRTKLGEAHNLAKSQTQLARLDLDEDRGVDAVPLARAAVEQRRKEDNPAKLAEDLRTLARALVAAGRSTEAVVALDESNRIVKPEPASPDAREDALIRGLADPAHADVQLPIIQAAQHAPGCPACEITAQLDEATLELGLGHTARARALLQQIQRRAKAMPAGNIVARTTRLLAK